MFTHTKNSIGHPDALVDVASKTSTPSIIVYVAGAVSVVFLIVCAWKYSHFSNRVKMANKTEQDLTLRTRWGVALGIAVALVILCIVIAVMMYLGSKKV